jgi:hypothetical protein
MPLDKAPTTGISLAGTDLSNFFNSSNQPYRWYRVFNIKPEGAVGFFKTSYKFKTYEYGTKGDMSNAWTPQLRDRYMCLAFQGFGAQSTTSNRITNASLIGGGNSIQEFQLSRTFTDNGFGAIWTGQVTALPINDAGTAGTHAVGTYYGQFLYWNNTNNIVTRRPGLQFTNYDATATVTLQPYIIYRHTDAARQMSFRLLRDGTVIQTQPGTTNAASTNHTYNFSNITVAANTTAYFRLEGSILTGTGNDQLYLVEFGFRYVSIV